ncbi:MAG TPA: hypothetical protein VM674_00770 [Candidatus Acidoferrum sp.]|nr:hypothetical protein [Candidatus Acidoferrum sp.]
MMRSVFVAGIAIGVLAVGALTATAGISHRSDVGRVAALTTLTRAMGETASDAEKANATTAQSEEPAQTARAQTETQVQAQTETEAQDEAQDDDAQGEDVNENDDVGEQAEAGAAAQAAPTTVQPQAGEKDDQNEAGDD